MKIFNFKTVSNCPYYENYSPCECFPEGGAIRCGNQAPDVIHSTFEKLSPTKISELNLEYFFSLPEGLKMLNLTENLLANHVVTYGISIGCYQLSCIIEIHPNAFNNATINSIEKFSISGMEMNYTIDWTFIKTFRRLKYLLIYCSSNIDLVNWSELVLSRTSSEFEEYINANKNDFGGENLAPIKALDLSHNQMSDSTMAQALEIFSITSNESLQNLTISYNLLMRIPKETQLFKGLVNLNMREQIYFFSQGISSIPQGSLKFNNQVSVHTIILEKCGINEISPNAFQGKGWKNIFGIEIYNLMSFEQEILHTQEK